MAREFSLPISVCSLIRTFNVIYTIRVVEWLITKKRIFSKHHNCIQHYRISYRRICVLLLFCRNGTHVLLYRLILVESFIYLQKTTISPILMFLCLSWTFLKPTHVLFSYLAISMHTDAPTYNTLNGFRMKTRFIPLFMYRDGPARILWRVYCTRIIGLNRFVAVNKKI